MTVSNRATYTALESGLTSILKAELVSKQAELLSLAQEVNIEESTVQHLCKQVERKRLEAHEISSEWTEKSGALLSKKNKHELLLEDIRMQTAYLERLRHVETGGSKEYTFEEHLKQENKELEAKYDRLQQDLRDVKASTDEEITRLKVGVDALTITNRYTRASLNQKIDVLKAENRALMITNQEEKASMGEEIDSLKAEVASLTTINKNVRRSMEENERLNWELNELSDRVLDEKNYLEKWNEGLKKEVEGLKSSVNDLTYRNIALKEEVEGLKLSVEDLTHSNAALKRLRDTYGDLKAKATFLDDEERTSWEEHPRVKELIAKREAEMLDKHKALIELGAKVRKSFIERNQPGNSSSSSSSSEEVLPKSLEALFQNPNPIADALVFSPAPVGYRTTTCRLDGTYSYSYIYGVEWSTVLRLKSCFNFVQLIKEYARMKTWNPQSFMGSDFFKAWSKMGVSFSDMNLEETEEWTDDLSNYAEVTSAFLAAKKGQEVRVANKARDEKISTALKRRVMAAGIAIRSRYLEMMLPAEERNLEIISKGDEAAHYADAELDAALYDDRLLEGLAPLTNTCTYTQVYKHLPIVIQCMRGKPYNYVENYIQMLNWYARVFQWHYNSRDFHRTKLYAAWPNKFFEMIGKEIYLAIGYFTVNMQDPSHDIFWKNLQTLYLEEETENKRKHRRVD